MEPKSTNISRNYSHHYASFLVALSAILYGFLAFFGMKLIQLHFTISNMLFWRFITAGLSVHIWSLRKEKRIIKNTANWRALINIFLLGFIFYAGGSILFFISGEKIGTGLAMVIFYTFPLIVILMSLLIEKHKPNHYTLIAVFATLLGTTLLGASSKGTVTMPGLLYGLLAALCYALYIYGSKFLVSKIPSIQITLVVCYASALFFLISSLLTHTLLWPQSWMAWIYIFAIGIIATALPILLMLEGLTTIHANKASIISILEPIVTLIMGISFLGEHITEWQFLGAVIVLFGVIYVQFEKI